MAYCRNCGSELPEGAQVCPKCGFAVSQPVQTYPSATRSRRRLSPWALAGFAVLGFIILIALVSAFFFSGLFPFTSVVGSGHLQTQQENVTGFAIIDVSSGFRVQITRADAFSVRITADDNVLPYVQVTKNGETLSIGLTPGTSIQTTTLKAEITMPDLSELRFSGGVTGTATGFESSHDFRTEMSGGSKLMAEGKAANLVVSCSGGSELDLSDFPVSNADVDLSGGSQATINLSGTLNANISGGSRLFYLGNPTLGNINTSGGSSIARKSSS